jgi:hypothetical protein
MKGFFIIVFTCMLMQGQAGIIHFSCMEEGE